MITWSLLNYCLVLKRIIDILAVRGFTMRTCDLILKKRDGQSLNADEIDFLITGYLKGLSLITRQQRF